MGPLVIISGFLVALLLLSIPLTLMVHRLLDPICLTLTSKHLLRCCFPQGYSYVPPIWDGRHEYISTTLGLFEKNYDKATIRDNFKQKPIAKLPQATKYTHACAPLCHRLLPILNCCTWYKETASAS